jgi:hypothetical protein
VYVLPVRATVAACIAGESTMGLPFAERRKRLEALDFSTTGAA